MESPHYQAYLLRVWRESNRDPWRAMLEDPHTGERHYFAGVAELLTYLAQQWPEADEMTLTLIDEDDDPATDSISGAR